MEELQQAAFEMIAVIGQAKGYFFQAVDAARKGKLQEAKQMMQQGNQILNEAHKHHFSFIQQEASGISLPYSILFMHAEDQLLTTAMMKEMCEQLMEVYSDINELKTT
ncbi:PTS lactose/cellobiose transporter subunit IIA [[Eubacterium] hominis]|uniref:PTS lactose/cellobiose transporter subunit IIA n=1 Tax=[Eubacterium] hominis TaxID=2764325 RepID=UPI003A4E4010